MYLHPPNRTRCPEEGSSFFFSAPPGRKSASRIVRERLAAASLTLVPPAFPPRSGHKFRGLATLYLAPSEIGEGLGTAGASGPPPFFLKDGDRHAQRWGPAETAFRQSPKPEKRVSRLTCLSRLAGHSKVL